MKIQCDVCGKQEACVFCTAEEASLCQSCDLRVHRANKLAGKHPRFSLLHPSGPKDSPPCDICRERRALLFCQEDRALLCRECDVPIHNANEYTRNHNRFLLTGIKLSAAASYQVSSSFSTSNTGSGSNAPSEMFLNMNASESISTAHYYNNNGSYHTRSQEGSVSTSSISEYLIETLPSSGWHVEDLLDPPSSPYVFCKINDRVISPFANDEVESNFGPIRNTNSLSKSREQ